MKQTALPIVVLLVIVSLAFVSTWPSGSLEADHYQRFHDGKSLYGVLSGRIATGDSLEDVETVLGPGVSVTDGAVELRVKLREQARFSPARFPQGIHDEDVFVHWPVEDDTVTLQFRNHTLVNHLPSQFADYRPVYEIAGRQEPSSNTEELTVNDIVGSDIVGQSR